MPSRTLNVGGQTWNVFPSGFITTNTGDEFSLLFVKGSGAAAEVRVTRYSPRGAMSREASLAEMSERELQELFGYSQPSATSPEAGYRA